MTRAAKLKPLRYQCANCPALIVTYRFQVPPSYCPACRKKRSQP